jgi:hypothetical protein
MDSDTKIIGDENPEVNAPKSGVTDDSTTILSDTVPLQDEGGAQPEETKIDDTVKPCGLANPNPKVDEKPVVDRKKRKTILYSAVGAVAAVVVAVSVYFLCFGSSNQKDVPGAEAVEESQLSKYPDDIAGFVTTLHAALNGYGEVEADSVVVVDDWDAAYADSAAVDIEAPSPY